MLDDTNHTRIAVTLLLGSLATYTAYRSVRYLYQRDKVKRLKQQLAKDIASSSFKVTYQPGVGVGPVDPQEAAAREEITREQLARNYAFLGEEIPNV
ncbi:hypothetical protein HDU67_001406 [Dinochytrium kinnereticum]|nr:hypothetical protein HDU67_001406 [Dinochytrium kinnereticum]